MKANLGQAVLIHMQGNAKGWVLQLIKQYKNSDWPEWLDITIWIGKDAVNTLELCTLIESKFTQDNWPKYMPKQL